MRLRVGCFFAYRLGISSARVDGGLSIYTMIVVGVISVLRTSADEYTGI